MKKIIGLYLFFNFSAYFNAQKVNLVWEGNEVIDYGSSKKAYPKFTNQGYSVENGNVFINIKNEFKGAKVKVKNFHWKQINSEQILQAEENSLYEFDFQGITYEVDPLTQKDSYYVKVATLKKENGKIYQLESFEIVADDTPKAIARTLQAKASSAENPLKEGNFYKIKVDKSGVFRITKKFLQDSGINITNINPKNLKIYGNGGALLPEAISDTRISNLQELAIQVVGEEDNVWNDTDYALFYAKGADAFNLFGKYGQSLNYQSDYRNDRTAHTKNIYDDGAYYFITFDQGPGKRIAEQDSELGAEIITRYDDYQFLNNDKANLLKLGRTWVEDSFSSEKKVTFNLNTPIQPTDEITYRLSVVSYTGSRNSISFNINGENPVVGTIPNSGSQFYKYTVERTLNNLSGNSINFNITPNTAANPNGSFYFDYVEVKYKQDLTFNNTEMNFRYYDIVEGINENYGFAISNGAAIEQVWEVTDFHNVSKRINKTASSGNFSFGYLADNEMKKNEFVAFKATSAYSPTFVAKIANQDINSLQGIDYLIITRKDMLMQGERMAKYYQDTKQYKTAVVDVDQIYNEYSSGGRDITAIRDFIAYLHHQRGGVKYVLLIGDTSYDYKNLTAGNDNVVPSYQSEESSNYDTSFVTDDYFVMLNPNGSTYITSNLPSIPIGRLPASNPTEAKLLVDKTLAYYNALNGQSSPFGEWRMKLNFVADDDAEGGGPFHNVMNTTIVNNFENGTERKEYNIRKLYFDAFPAEITAGGQRYPQINQAISNDVGNSLYLFYFGHGGINGWGQERVLSTDEIQGFNNYNPVYSRFPFVSTITCEFTLWDEPKVNSAGEQVIKHPNGGAATMITSSRAIGVSFGRNYTNIFTKHIFRLNAQNDFNTLGDAHLAAKLETGNNSNHLRVNYLGDPAMKLSRPKQNLTIENINTPVPGKIRALDFIKISGKVTKEDGSIDENFNGRAVINIFDKRLNKTTLNNDKTTVMTPLLSYTEENSPIVKASGKVVNGAYTVEFYVPKDINYDLGEGRILAYADNFETAKTKAYDVFQNQSYQVGEINPNGINDNTPPIVKLYLNNINFADGGITDQNPNLLACITDDTGINSTGSGIGHDITVILDGEIVNTKVLNDFFSPGEGNGCVNPNLAEHQKGNVSYPFRNLKPGPHQLTFKVWDINNNSTTQTLNFVVKDETDNKLVLNRLLNWPNPFTDKTYIHFEHNCDDILEVNVQIFTITGKLVRTLSNLVSSEPFMQGYRTPKQAIEWDGRDDYGDTVAKGTYIYKVFARSQSQDKCKGGATAVEKLVLLK